MTGALLILDTSSISWKMVHHRFDNKSVLEHTVSAFLKAEQIQNIVLILPQSERKNVSGNGIHSPIFSRDRLGSTKNFFTEFYVESEDKLLFANQVCSKYGFSNVVVANATSGLMPQWFINEVVYSYFTENRSISTKDVFDKHFNLAVLPAWQLARLASHSDERDFSKLFDLEHKMLNANNAEIIHCKYDLDLHEASDHTLLEHAYKELALGVDINDIIEYLNDK